MDQTLSHYATALYKDFFVYTTRELQKLGLNYGQLPFILYLGNHPGCTPAELTAALNMDWGHSQRSVSKLAELGILQKSKGSRTYSLTLTEQGEHAFSVAHQVFFSWDDARLSVLTDEEKNQLFSLLQKVAAKSGAPCVPDSAVQPPVRPE